MNIPTAETTTLSNEVNKTDQSFYTSKILRSLQLSSILSRCFALSLSVIVSLLWCLFVSYTTRHQHKHVNTWTSLCTSSTSQNINTHQHIDINRSRHPHINTINNHINVSTNAHQYRYINVPTPQHCHQHINTWLAEQKKILPRDFLSGAGGGIIFGIFPSIALPWQVSDSQ